MTGSLWIEVFRTFHRLISPAHSFKVLQLTIRHLLYLLQMFIRNTSVGASQAFISNKSLKLYICNRVASQ